MVGVGEAEVMYVPTGDDVANGSHVDHGKGNATDDDALVEYFGGADDFDVSGFIALNLGPRQIDPYVSVPMTICYCCIWIFGMAGKAAFKLILRKKRNI